LRSLRYDPLLCVDVFNAAVLDFIKFRINQEIKTESVASSVHVGHGHDRIQSPNWAMRM
jgi:hypothetical protein